MAHKAAQPTIYRIFSIQTNLYCFLPIRKKRIYFSTCKPKGEAGRIIIVIIVEFKFENYRTWDDRDEELMQTAAALLDAYQGLYVVESFNPAAMNWYKREHPDVCRGQLAEDTEFTKNPVLWMAGKLMFNEISRPDFVAYDFRNGNGAMLRFVRRMGAMAVAWTVRTSDELAGAQPYFDRFIFEAFVPKQ